MKKIRIVITVILISCLAVGWIAAFSGSATNIAKQNAALKNAREFSEKQLYQKSIEAYKTALSFGEKESIRAEMIKAYDLALDDGVISSKQYTAAYEEACELYPKTPQYWETLLQYYLNNKSYSKAYECYQKSLKASARSDKLTALGNEINYLYTVKPTNYSRVFRSPDGYCTVQKYDLWGIIRPDGESFVDCAYEYVSPMNSLGEAMFKSAKGCRVYNKSIVMQYKLSQEFMETKAYGCGMIPVKVSEDAWQFYDCESDAFVFDKYDDVSAFMNDLAFVKSGETWHIINSDGKQANDLTFSDIKLFDNGEYIYQNVIIMADSSGYHMYDNEFKQMNGFSAKDMDNYYGEYIAYQSTDGLWGYVDIKGNVIIEPKYIDAHSFSGGLASVAENVVEEETVEESAESTEPDEPVLTSTTVSDITSVPDSTTLSDSTTSPDVTVNPDITTSTDTTAIHELQSETSTVSAESVVQEENAQTNTTKKTTEISEENDRRNIVTKWGFIKLDGTQVIDSRYYYAGYFSAEGYALVADLIGSYYFIALRFV